MEISQQDWGEVVRMRHRLVNKFNHLMQSIEYLGEELQKLDAMMQKLALESGTASVEEIEGSMLSESGSD